MRSVGRWRIGVRESEQQARFFECPRRFLKVSVYLRLVAVGREAEGIGDLAWWRAGWAETVGRCQGYELVMYRL